jgi:hypothetical protein
MTSRFRSVEIFLERLPQDVLIRAPLSSPQRAKADVSALVNLERQGDRRLVSRYSPCRLRPAPWGLLLQSSVPISTTIVHVFT